MFMIVTKFDEALRRRMMTMNIMITVKIMSLISRRNGVGTRSASDEEGYRDNDYGDFELMRAGTGGG